jgi:hypothetical protein
LLEFAEQLDEGKNLAKTVEAIKDANKRGALHFAAIEGQTEICNYLLQDLKLNIDSKDDDGETPLIHAARQGHTATAKYLIDRGADATIASNLGATALHHSAGIGFFFRLFLSFFPFCLCVNEFCLLYGLGLTYLRLFYVP